MIVSDFSDSLTLTQLGMFIACCLAGVAVYLILAAPSQLVKYLYARFLLLIFGKSHQPADLTDEPHVSSAFSNQQYKTGNSSRKLDTGVVDSLKFYCVKAIDNTCAVFEISRYPNRLCSMKLSLNLPGVGLFEHPYNNTSLIANNDGKSFSCGGLSMHILEKGRRWRITYSGLLKKVKPPHASSTNIKDISVGNSDAKGDSSCIESELYNSGSLDDNVKVKLAFLWNNLSEPIFEADSSTQAKFLSLLSLKAITAAARSRSTTFVQSGEMHGTVRIEEDQETVLRMRGFRKRSHGHTPAMMVEHMTVSKQGYFEFYSLPMSSRITPNLGDLCAIRVAPNTDCYLLKDLYPFHLQPGTEAGLSCRLNNSYAQNDCPYDTLPPCDMVRGEMLSSGFNHQIYPLSWSRIKNDRKEVVDSGRGLLILHALNLLSEDRRVDSLIEDTKIAEQICSVPHLTVTSESPNTARLVVTLGDPECRNTSLVGGKGSQLAVLAQSSHDLFRVPPAICLTVNAFHTHLNMNTSLLEVILDLERISHGTHNNLQNYCTDIHDKFLGADIDITISNDLEQGMKEEFGEDFLTRMYAVRSSAIGEDGEELSAAGQMDTILGVKGYQQLLSAIQRCWASHFNLTSVQYKRQHGQALNAGMGVVIQELIQSDVAGVLFTADPVTSNRNMMLINANFGIGESVVSGQVDPDTFHISRYHDDTLEITTTHLGGKAIVYKVSDDGDGCSKSNNCDQTIFCLSREEILALCKIGAHLEKGFGAPCDIEWAIKDDHIYLLQSRPITTLDLESDYELLHEFDGPISRDDEVLSTMNVGEILPGAVTPLSLDIVIRSIDSVLQGNTPRHTPKKEVSACIKTVCNTLLIDVHMLEFHPGVALMGSRKMMELSLAGHVLDYITDEEIRMFHPSIPPWKRISHPAAFMWRVFTAHSKLMALERSVNEMITPMDEDCRHLLTFIKKANLVHDKVLYHYMAVAGRSAVISSIIMGILTGGATEWTSIHYGDLAKLLGLRMGDVHSAGIPEMLAELAATIARNGCAAQFEQLSPLDAVRYLRQSAGLEVSDKFQEFMTLYGHRGFRELELAEKCWTQRPEDVVETVQLLVRNPRPSSASKEPTVDDVLASLSSKVTPFGKKIIKWLLPKAKDAVDKREVGKGLYVKSVSVSKLAYWRLSQLLCKQGVLPEQNLLFFLTHDEIEQLIISRSGKLVSRAQRRYRVFSRQKEMRFERFSRGVPVSISKAIDEHSTENTFELKGMPVSVGEVTGIARVVVRLEDAHVIQKGDVLIVPYTDVGWAPFFPMISGIVTEQGGLVSHGAVVAREYGIPSIASCCSATSLVLSGDTVILNGTVGSLKCIRASSLTVDEGEAAY